MTHDEEISSRIRTDFVPTCERIKLHLPVRRVNWSSLFSFEKRTLAFTKLAREIQEGNKFRSIGNKEIESPPMSSGYVSDVCKIAGELIL